MALAVIHLMEPLLKTRKSVILVALAAARLLELESSEEELETLEEEPEPKQED